MPRSIITHVINPANDRITITAVDEPGPGGAHHVYDTKWEMVKGAIVEGPTLKFQKGAIAEVGVNGLTNEALIAVLIDRLNGFQAGPYACAENAAAVAALHTALDALLARTKARMARGVEGTMQK
jgi:hypothetical protein